jgi:hypothetical protein
MGKGPNSQGIEAYDGRFSMVPRYRALHGLVPIRLKIFLEKKSKILLKNKWGP